MDHLKIIIRFQEEGCEFLYVLLLTVSAVTDIHSQRTGFRPNYSNCPPVEVSDLGSTTSLSTDGIVPAAFRSTNESSVPMVQILRHNVVCEVAGRWKDTVGQISVLVEYQCLGLGCPGYNSSQPSNILNVTSQFQVKCVFPLDMYVSFIGYVATRGGGAIRVDNAVANFTTAIDRECGACVDPATGCPRNKNNDPVTFCGGMLTLCSYCMFYSYSISFRLC